MPTTDGGCVVVALDETECDALLLSARIGRLAFTRNALPAIQPVSYRLCAGEVVIPALPDSEFLPGTRDTVVAFGIDTYDDEERTGWSVMVVGPCREVSSPTEVAVFDALPWPLPTTVPDRRYVAVRIGMVRGWRTVSLGHGPVTTSRDRQG